MRLLVKRFLLTFSFINIIFLSLLYIKYGIYKGTLFDGYNNFVPFDYPVIPNVIHFIIFNCSKLNFISFLAFAAAFKVQRPDAVLVHCDCVSLEGPYWQLLISLSNLTSVPLRLIYRPRPTHVFGQPISSVYHATDIARIQVLMETGGIYLDTDALVLKPLHPFRHFEMVLGWPHDDYIGTQVLLAHKEARFLTLWLNGYRRYRPRLWYYNAGQFPTQQVLLGEPGLVHRVPTLFGVHNLLDRLYGEGPWPQWRHYYAVHLLSRHEPAPQHINHTSLPSLPPNMPFRQMANHILYQLDPALLHSAQHDIGYWKMQPQ